MRYPTVVTVPASSASARRGEGSSRDASGVKVFDKLVRVLELFTPEQPVWSTTELARTLEMPVPTVHRIVRTLASHGYLSRSDDARYRLGFAAVDLGRRALASLELSTTLRPVLQAVLRDVQETVVLSVHDERRQASLTLARVEARHSLRLTLDVGVLTPLHAGASGKCMLAFLGEEVIDAVLSRPLEPITRHTITDPHQLRAELDRIRVLGWSISFEETNIGAWGVAAPIRSQAGSLIAVVGVAAPAARYSEAAAGRFTQRVLAAAADAAAILGS